MAKMTAETMMTEKQSAYSKGRDYKGMGLKDGTQASSVRSIQTDVNPDKGKIQEFSCGNKGYSQQALNYKY